MEKIIASLSSIVRGTVGNVPFTPLSLPFHSPITPLLLFLLVLPLCSLAQKVDPQAYYIDKNGDEVETRNIEKGEAPLPVTFRANPSEMDEYTPSYEWHFRKETVSDGITELFVRYEEDTQYTFTESGTFKVVLKTFLDQDETMLDSTEIVITIPDSKLVFPNSFSPNDDTINDVYGAIGLNDPEHTDHWRSIVEFHAYIFNRWGQKLFEWTDINKGWDGKYKGHPVKEGTYFVVVNAKGADGVVYNIRKDVNLIRGHHDRNNTPTGGDEGGGEGTE
ncbi:MAG: gliding motility-associated C-terminal domain-containing protein [Prevotella sp.]|nr:gliding motility-associated C-terminal domain-containing protein [Prevotella sp.]